MLKNRIAEDLHKVWKIIRVWKRLLVNSRNPSNEVTWGFVISDIHILAPLFRKSPKLIGLKDISMKFQSEPWFHQ